MPVADEAAAKKARQALAAIQEEWDQIGYVPREAMHRIESRLDAVDRQIKAVEDAAWKQTDPEADARKSSFEVQLTAQLAELDEKIAAETDPKKKAALEAEKAHQGAVAQRDPLSPVPNRFSLVHPLLGGAPFSISRVGSPVLGHHNRSLVR